MTITYKDTKTPGKDALEALFLSVDWDSGNHPEQLERAIRNSSSVFTAWDGEQLIGLINVLSDGNMAAYIHYLLVHPAYQSQGIGRELVQTALTEYAHVAHKVLVAYNPQIGFYERCGFHLPTGTSPMFMTELHI